MSYYNNNNRWGGRGRNHYNNNRNYGYYDESSSDSDDSDSSSYSDSSSSDSDDDNNNNNYSNNKNNQQDSNLHVKVNKSGYRQYYNHNEGRWNFTHRTVAEKKIGRPIQYGEHVHHINKDKTDNRPQNVVVLKENIHRELHKSSENERDCCFICGRTSHWASDCFAKTDIHGNDL